MSFLSNFFGGKKEIQVKGEDNQSVAQQEFISLATHQLKTPLAAIKWTLKMFIDGDAGELNPEQKMLLTKSYENNEMVIRLIDQMMSADRLRAGFKLALADTDIVALAQHEVDDILPVAQKKNIHIEVTTDKAGVPHILIDPERIKLVIQNLLENAIKYTFQNGAIYVDISKKDSHIVISVRDNGIGIPRDVQKDIFKKFFRADNAKKVESAGSGLGLFIAKSIVVGHSGDMWFESEENRGSTFFVSLPIR